MRSLCCLVVLGLLSGCAGLSAQTPGGGCCPESRVGTGGSGPPTEEPWVSPGSPDPRWAEPDDEARRQAELQAAIEQISRVASANNREGARIDFTLSASNGALTLQSWESSIPARPVERESGDTSFWKALGLQHGQATPQRKGLFQLASLQGPALIHLSLQRTGTGWMLDSVSRETLAQLPPEARTLPVNQPPIPTADWEAASKAAGELVRNLRAPGNAGAGWLLTVEMEDERIRSLSTGSGHPGGKLSTEPSEATLAWELANALLPFLQGLGTRTVDVQLRAELLPGQTRPRWHVVGAATVHPARPAISDDEALTVAEYRHIHEETLRQWREDSRHYAEVGARFTAREIALWFVSGWAMHGVGAVVKYTASPVWRMLTRGGPLTEGWLECLLRRIPRAERGALRRLWAKVDLEGIEALTAEERKALGAWVERFEQVASTPLTDSEKETFREIARKRFWTYIRNLDPQLAATLVTETQRPYEVHHLIPLEYAELFIEMDINATENLVAVSRQVHDSIGSIWTTLRSTRTAPTAAEIRKVAAIINQNYSRWYNRVYNPATSAAQLDSAEAATRAALKTLFK